MNNLKIHCLCIHDELLEKVKKLKYLPVALGEHNYREGWIRDNIGNNISYKNKYYGEYTFHYWIWKNYLNNLDRSDPFASTKFEKKFRNFFTSRSSVFLQNCQ